MKIRRSDVPACTCSPWHIFKAIITQGSQCIDISCTHKICCLCHGFIFILIYQQLWLWNCRSLSAECVPPGRSKSRRALLGGLPPGLHGQMLRSRHGGHLSQAFSGKSSGTDSMILCGLALARLPLMFSCWFNPLLGGFPLMWVPLALPVMSPSCPFHACLVASRLRSLWGEHAHLETTKKLQRINCC